MRKLQKKLAYYKAEFNLLHPFREGNGRTIRLFIYLYALSKDFM
ncbi:Fic family protein [Lysinibacillus boronitolerans]|nr:Fic family protein [Lysinibacillus boronitolerans]